MACQRGSAERTGDRAADALLVALADGSANPDASTVDDGETSEATAISRAVTISILAAALAGALALSTGHAAAGGDHFHYHGHYGPYRSFHPGFGYGLGVRYTGVYYYGPPPVYYRDPVPPCGWDGVRVWRYGRWRFTRIWRCW